VKAARYRDTVRHPAADGDLPVAGYPLVLRVAVPRYRCLTPECGRAVFTRTLGNWPPHARRPRGGVLGM
jgi:transposase